MATTRMYPLEERLLSFLLLDGSCWSWTGSTYPNGYGKLTVDGRSGRLAHRISYETFVGPVPEGLTLDHLCRNPRCINPEHLEPVTQRENILRGNNMAARHARQTHCLRGHPLSGENLGVNRRPDGREWRYCRTCVRSSRKGR